MSAGKKGIKLFKVMPIDHIGKQEANKDMKQFDVHFNLFFSDMLTGIEAENRIEAIEKAKEILNVVLDEKIQYLISLGDGEGFETQFTDVLEVGKDI